MLGLAGVPLLGAAMAEARGFRRGGGGALQALTAGEFSLESSRIALRRANSPLVRQFAGLEAEEQLAYARALGAAPGSAPVPASKVAMLQQLQALRGRSFDAAYIRGQIMGHRQLLRINSALSRGGSSQVERSVATVAVPAIKSHLAFLSQLRGLA